MNGNGTSAKTASSSVAPGRDGATPLRERTAAAVEMDGLLRRKLRVTNPNDPSEIASALGRTYPNEKVKLDREAGGLPFATGTVVERPPVIRSTRFDSDASVDAVDRDLNALRSTTLLSGIEPELRGWAAAIRSAMLTGLTAASGAFDPMQRERVFSSRRVLGDYARLARYVAILNPAMPSLFRQLARSLDAVAAELLVRLGDGLADAGLVGSRFLPQAAGTDLQTRREAVVLALRGLQGTSPVGAPDGWPRGLVAHQQVSDLLQTGGYADLLPLLEETYLTRQLDDLADMAAGTNSDGLRGLASSAETTLNGLRRLILVCQGAAAPPSPTLEAFRAALHHFLDPFDPAQSATGYRLPFIAQPPLLMSRQAGMAVADVGTRALLDLTALRFSFVEEVDYFFEYDVQNDARTRQQLLLDACIQCLDRAIDLYALGTDRNGDAVAEWRSSAFGYLAHVIRRSLPMDPRAQNARRVLRRMQHVLVYWAPRPAPNPLPIGRTRFVRYAINEELVLLRASEIRWYELARSLTSSFVGWSRTPRSPMLQFIGRARAMAGAMPIPGFIPAVPRDVATILHTNLP